MSKKDSWKISDAEIKRMFQLFDLDGSGSISSKELANVLRMLGQNPTEKEIRQIIVEVDKDDSGTVDYEEFAKMARSMCKSLEEVDGELREAFKVFDKNQDGYITKDEIRQVMTSIGDAMSEEDAEKMLAEADIDGDGRINYEEFVLIMNR